MAKKPYKRSFKNFFLIPEIQLSVVYSNIINNVLFLIAILWVVIAALNDNYNDFLELKVDFAAYGYDLDTQIRMALLIPMSIFFVLSCLNVVAIFIITHKFVGPLFRINLFFGNWIRNGILTELRVRKKDPADAHLLANIITYTFARKAIDIKRRFKVIQDIKLGASHNFDHLSTAFHIIFFILGILNIVQLVGYYNYYFDLFPSLQDHMIKAGIHKDIQYLFDLEINSVKNQIIYYSIGFSLFLIIMNYRVIKKLLQPARDIQNICLEIVHKKPTYGALLKKFKRNAPNKFYEMLSSRFVELVSKKRGGQLRYQTQEEIEEEIRKQEEWKAMQKGKKK